jgi:nucleoporin GLE1
MPPHEPGIDYNKLNGFREDESVAEFTSRVAGLLRVYFHILVAPVNIPLDPMFRTTRYWAFFARMLGDRRLLEGGPVAPELLASKCPVLIIVFTVNAL